ncbi:type III-B CRISPR module RAMP protein Cmr4 [Paenibacillus sp. YYML68]|uniref:type III-B CRISPR module RAMP protein Cmr4 n=1 Tax=Paenibacillus sp. YYML68 TaxID=2909250 RepID=UPI00248F9A3F|nr:type III-B CRISPR module RAMP protein Cmr4 [Paenibacillus sp. YYML68]
MHEASRFYYIHCLSPVHVGSGQGVGLIDQPIVREKMTSWPMIPGSSMKGVLRDHYNRYSQHSQLLSVAFGVASSHSNDSTDGGNAGALSFSDARLLAFPVMSLSGTFAYVTCPLVLRRLVRDAAAADVPVADPGCDEIEQILQASDDTVIVPVPMSESRVVSENTVILDEFECQAQPQPRLNEWTTQLAQRLFEDKPSQKIFRERLVIVSDEAFQYFVTICCEVTPRIRIDDSKGIVDQGGLWTEEYLPAESILYGLMWYDQADATTFSIKDILQPISGTLSLAIGGHITVGKGRTRFRFDGGVSL